MDVTPGQGDGDHSNSQSIRKNGRWDVHLRIGIDDWQVYEEDERKRGIYNNRDHPYLGDGQEEEGGPEKGRRLLCDREELGIPVLKRGVPSTWDVGPLDSVCFSPLKQAIALSEPNFWIYSLQIHCNGFGPKTVTL